MKTGILLISALLGSSSTMIAQNYLAYTKTNLDLLDSNNTKVKHIEKGDAILVESEHVKHGKYKITHLKTKKIGFVHKHDVKIYKEVDESEKTNLTGKASEVKDPLVEIHNSSRQTLFIKFDDVEFEMQPHETHTLKVSKGNYYYKVYADGMDAHYDFAKLQEFKKYDWDFYVDEEPVNNNLGYSSHKMD